MRETFNKFDRNGNGKLELDEFEAALNSYGMFLKKYEAQALIKYFDKDGDKCINFHEFIGALQ
jgi:Ca2+-binding EF-hand superfamily protein